MGVTLTAIVMDVGFVRRKEIASEPLGVTQTVKMTIAYLMTTSMSKRSTPNVMLTVNVMVLDSVPGMDIVQEIKMKM
jgi:hypothetical protein